MVNKFYGEQPKDIDNPIWDVMDISPNGIIVTWNEKYGASCEKECIGLWYSKELKQYRLTFKSSEFYIIEESNINSISSRKK